MKEQHKGMFIDLREGRLDQLIDEVLGFSQSRPSPSQVSPEASPAAADSMVSSARKSSPASRKLRSQAPARRRSGPPSANPRTRAPAMPVVSEVRFSPGAGSSGTEPAAQAAAAAAHSSVPVSGPASEPVVSPGLGASGNPGSLGAENTLNPPPSSLTGAKHGSGRYGATRPSAGFGSPDPSSIFGGSQVSEQSLDDVILSYISEDLEGPANTGE